MHADVAQPASSEAAEGVIEAGIGRKDYCAATRELQHIFEVNGGKWRLPGYEDELAVFLQHYVR